MSAQPSLVLSALAQTTSQVHHVPEAPVLIALLGASLSVMAWRLQRGSRSSWPRTVTGAITCLYLVAIAREVFGPFQVGMDRRFVPGWRAFVHLTPLYGAEASDVALNTLLFLPFGMLLPLLTRARSLMHITVLGLLFSLCIETSQLVLDVMGSVGHIADVNDLIGNTVGAFAGALTLRMITSNPRVGRVTNSLTWCGPSPSPVDMPELCHAEPTLGSVSAPLTKRTTR